MDQQLSVLPSNNPLGYLNSTQEAQVLQVRFTRAPTTSDRRFKLGTIWTNTSTNSVYILANVTNGSAHWELMAASAGDVTELTGDSGGPVIPSSGNINILGNSLGHFLGSGSTLTYTPQPGGYPLTPFVVGRSGQAGYQTIQSAINAAHAAVLSTGDPQSVYIQPGTYTENLTAYDKVSLIGATGAVDNHYVTIIGTHTPPTSGQVDMYGIFWQGATAIWQSAAAGSTQFNFFNNIMQLTGNGYTFDLVNWTGLINGFVFLQLDGPGSNGLLNNASGSSSLILINSAINLFPSNATAIFHNAALVEWDNMYIGIKCNYTGSTVVNINGGNYFLNTHTFSDSSSGVITSTSFQTGANPAIIYNSSGNTSLISSNIISSASPCIQGTSTGTLTITGVDFQGNSAVAGTVTAAYGTSRTGNEILNGNLTLNAAGNKILSTSVASTTTAGANSFGTVTLVGGTATVSTTAVTASSIIYLFRQGIGATGAAALGILTVGTITAGTSFVIRSVQAADATALEASDVSSIGWMIVN